MTKTLSRTVPNIDPSQPTIDVRVIPSAITDAALVELREVGKPIGRLGDCLRTWLGDRVAHEIARRNSATFDIEETPCWAIPWHTWNDAQLAAALVTSYCWYDVPQTDDGARVLREIHRAVVTACATRLGELHDAIEQSRKGR